MSQSKMPVRPGPGRPTQDQIEKRNQELLACAFKLFVENGFEGTTVAAIADEVGMAKRTVYSRYQDKEMLFAAATQGAVQRWAIPLKQFQNAECDDLSETLLALAIMWANNILSPLGRQLVRLTNNEVYRHPEIGLYTIEHGSDPFISFLISLFARRIPDIDPDDLDDAARTFVNIVGVLPTRWASSGEPVEEAAVQQSMGKRVRWFLMGLLPR